ncbi:hypothetical protein F4803DRAFT_537358 [Xylaria telfairii]|nr:hypothetical protein F4803DRAFT_537358 [Xylaria telfairii]
MLACLGLGIPILGTNSGSVLVTDMLSASSQRTGRASPTTMQGPYRPCGSQRRKRSDPRLAGYYFTRARPNLELA